jgi:glycosyltransferase involved in cell wall biosynthesis
MPKVSVIIPTYQSGKYITQAVDSVLSQSFGDYEIIIVDDGSTDDTHRILYPYLSSGKIRLITQPNRGPAAARNNGMKNSIAEYVAFLDADDLWQSEKLEKQVTFLNQNPSIDLIYSDATIFSETQNWSKTHFELSPPAKDRVFENLFIRNFIPLLTTLVRRKVIEEVNGFDESFFGPEDYDLWLRLCNKKNIEPMIERLAMYRISSGQVTKQKIRMVENEIRVKEKAFGYAPELLTAPRFVLDPGYYNLLIRIAKLYLQENKVGEARAYLNKYKSQRGVTTRYLLLETIALLPSPLRKMGLSVWERIRPRRGLEMVGIE